MSIETTLVCDSCGSVVASGADRRDVRARVTAMGGQVARPGGQDLCPDCTTAPAARARRDVELLGGSQRGNGFDFVASFASVAAAEAGGLARLRKWAAEAPQTTSGQVLLIVGGSTDEGDRYLGWPTAREPEDQQWEIGRETWGAIRSGAYPPRRLRRTASGYATWTDEQASSAGSAAGGPISPGPGGV